MKYRRYFPERHHEFIGVRMGAVFAAARDFAGMDLDQIERLLENDAHEVRAGAVRIMAEQAKARSTTGERLQALAALYLRRHDRIDDWDLVDLGAWEVLGRSLLDRPRGVLDELAVSDDPWRRRSAITATFAFIRRDELDDTYRIATRLLDDEHELVRKAVGWALRNAGDHDQGGCAPSSRRMRRPCRGRPCGTPSRSCRPRSGNGCSGSGVRADPTS